MSTETIRHWKEASLLACFLILLLSFSNRSYGKTFTHSEPAATYIAATNTPAALPAVSGAELQGSVPFTLKALNSPADVSLLEEAFSAGTCRLFSCAARTAFRVKPLLCRLSPYSLFRPRAELPS